MALSDHPNVLGLDPGDWETWIRNLYQLVHNIAAYVTNNIVVTVGLRNIVLTAAE